MKIILFIIFTLFCTQANSQSIKDKKLVLKNGIYDNLDSSRANDSQPFYILDKKTNKVLYKRVFTGSVCKECYNDVAAIAEKYKQQRLIDDAATIYNIAFRLNGNLGKVIDRYNAAICFSKLGQKDNALTQLHKIAHGGKYNNFAEITAEKAFNDLHTDVRWKVIVDRVKLNSQEFAEELNSKRDGYEIKN